MNGPSPEEVAPVPGGPAAAATGSRLVFARLACGVATLLGCTVLLGWAFDVAALRSAIPGAVEMKANTACGLVGVSAALFLVLTGRAGHPRRLADGLSVFVVLLGAVTLSEYAFGWNAGIDEWLVRDTGAAFNGAKGRMSPYSAVAFTALGGATFGLAHRWPAALLQTAGGLTAAIGFVSLIGYLWNAAELVTDRLAPPVAVNTAVALLLLGMAVVLVGDPREAAAGARRLPRSHLEAVALGGFVPTLLCALLGGGLAYRAAAGFSQVAEQIARGQQTAPMDAAQTARLDSQLQQLRQQRLMTLVWLLVTLGVLIALFLLLFRSIRREMLARGAVEADLQRLNASLEQRVAARTEELSFQQAFLRRVIDLNRSHISAKDREGRFVLANQALADFLGSTVDELVGSLERSVGGVADELRRLQASDLQVIESGEDLTIDEEQRTDAHGEPRWLWTVKRPILSPSGDATIVLGVSVDITERRAAREEVRALSVDLERRVTARTADLNESNRKLDQARLDSDAASRAKSAFLANMSHEIRTPMNAIIGLTHLMRRETLDSVQRERLDKVAAAAQHLLQVINDILDMSKIEAGKLTLDDTEFSLDELLAGASAMVSASAGEKHLELIVDTDHVPGRLVGDPVRLSQILINLLSNAVKFTVSGWVRLRVAVVGEDDQRLQLRFEVQDTGPGIAPERQAGLFNAFVQIDDSPTRQHGGTGLGLALSRQLAIAMGGDAGLVSAPGAGSTFWVTVWLKRGREAAERAPLVAASGLRALLVDDLPESLSVIGDLLRGIGFEVDALPSGPAALKKVEARMAAGQPHDVLLIDMRMEPLDGIDTLLLLRQRLGGGMPPSILVTAFDDPATVERAIAARFDAVLMKPIIASALRAKLLELLQPQGAGLPPSPPPATPDAVALLRERHAGQRVLFAEDNPVNRELGEELLRHAGLVVETADDGAQAVELALSRPYDLALMDVQMPVMDGMEATRTIRRRAGRGMPIVGMTAHAFVEDRKACLAAGMNDHIAKPVDPSRLYDLLLRWLPLRDPHGAAAAAASAGSADGAETPPAGSLLERLATLDGFDAQAALQIVADDLPLLARVLRRFATTYRHGVPALLDASGDAADVQARWRTSCHSLRGALGMVGASGLLQELIELERAMADSGEPAGEPLAARRRHFHQRVIDWVEVLEARLAR